MARKVMALVSLPAKTFEEAYTMISRVPNLVGSDSFAAIHFDSWPFTVLPFLALVDSPSRFIVPRELMAFSVKFQT